MKQTIDRLNGISPLALIIAGAISSGAIALLVFVHFFLGADIPIVKMQNYQSAAYWGQLGDFVGGMLNPILSFIAIIAVALSLISQKQYAISAEERSLTSIENQMEQTRTQQRQSFEAVFFSLLNLQSSCLSNVRHSDAAGQSKAGIEAFDSILASYPEQKLHESFIPGGGGNAARAAAVLYNFKAKNGPSLRHYIEIVEQILLYVDDFPSGVIADKSRYFSILRAMLSHSELKVLRYYIGGSESEALQRIALESQIFRDLT